MIVFGVILLVIGYVIPVATLVTLGWILVLVGIVLWIIGALGHPLLGRSRWY